MNMLLSIVSEVMVSGSGYTVPSLESFGGDSGCRVVEEETESSMSDTLDGVGDCDRNEEELKFLDRIFCVILV